MTTTIRGELEIYHDRGVIYFHNEVTGCNILRLQGLPRPIPEHFNGKEEFLMDFRFTKAGWHINWKGEDVERLRSNETNS
jgi:hypothetical protein